MNNKAFYLFLVFFISLRLTAQNDNTMLLVREAASLKALTFLNLIPVGREKDYGFESRNDFLTIKIEEPYQTYYVRGGSNHLEFFSGNEWRVPLSVDGVYKSLLTVQINNGKAEVIDFGGNVLAHRIQEFEKSYPDKSNQHVIIRNTFLERDYMATNFLLLCNQSNGNGFIEINENSLQPVYQLNEGKPLKTSIAVFCNETMDMINQRK